MAAVEESSVGVASAEPAATAAAPAPLAPRKGLVARFLARMRGDVVEPEPARPRCTDPVRATSTPIPAASVETSATAQTASYPRAHAPAPLRRIEPQPAAEPTADTQPAAEPDLATEPEAGSPAEAAVTPAVTETALKDALESLGTAHHRPVLSRLRGLASYAVSAIAGLFEHEAAGADLSVVENLDRAPLPQALPVLELGPAQERAVLGVELEFV